MHDACGVWLRDGTEIIIKIRVSNMDVVSELKSRSTWKKGNSRQLLNINDEKKFRFFYTLLTYGN